MKHKPDNLTRRINKWIRKNPSANRKRLQAYLERSGCATHGITHVLRGDKLGDLRKTIVVNFQIK
jgi:hypothetical protein